MKVLMIGVLGISGLLCGESAMTSEQLEKHLKPLRGERSENIELKHTMKSPSISLVSKGTFQVSKAGVRWQVFPKKGLGVLVEVNGEGSKVTQEGRVRPDYLAQQRIVAELLYGLFVNPKGIGSAYEWNVLPKQMLSGRALKPTPPYSGWVMTYGDQNQPKRIVALEPSGSELEITFLSK